MRADAPVPRVLDAVRACGGLLATALRASRPTVRAWHWGPTDPTGFAALGVNEILVHTWDIAQGLGLDWQPPAELAALVVQRLSPGAPTGDPVPVLLWSTGRIALPQHPRQESWSLHAAMNGRWHLPTRSPERPSVGGSQAVHLEPDSAEARHRHAARMFPSGDTGRGADASAEASHAELTALPRKRLIRPLFASGPLAESTCDTRRRRSSPSHPVGLRGHQR